MSRVVVDGEDLRLLARHVEDAADELVGILARAHLAAAEPALLATAALDPFGAARAVDALLAALDGPSGLLALSVRVRADGARLVAARLRYELVDNGPWGELVDLAGVLALTAARPAAALRDPGALAARAVDAVEATLTWSAPASELLAPLAAAVLSSPPVVTAALLATPAPLHGLILRGAAGRARFVVESVGWRPTSVEPLTGQPLVEWAERWPAGPGAARPTSLTRPGVSASSVAAAEEWRRVSGRAPGSLAGSMRRVAALSGLGEGRIAIEAVTGADGVTRYVVELPGIASLRDTPYPQDLPGAVSAAALAPSSYAGAVRRALDLAGVPTGAPALLVGHSQGGVVAMNLAGDPTFNGGRAQVTHVVAAGSPVTHVQALPGTRVLTVENTHDIVTHLDNEDSRHRAPDGARVDVAFSRDTGSVGANHSARLYADELAALADSPNPRLRAFVAGLAPYLRGRTTTTGWSLTDR